MIISNIIHFTSVIPTLLGNMTDFLSTPNCSHLSGKLACLMAGGSLNRSSLIVFLVFFMLFFSVCSTLFAFIHAYQCRFEHSPMQGLAAGVKHYMLSLLWEVSISDLLASICYLYHGGRAKESFGIIFILI